MMVSLVELNLMLSIKNDMITVMDAVYLLSNNNGYMDADANKGKGALIITGVE